MNGRTLSKTDMTRLLERLSERLRRKETFARLHVVGSACIALAYQRERTTEDIAERVETGDNALREAIRELAQEHGLPRTWLGDLARSLVPEEDDPRGPTLYDSQSLIVTGASGEYLLAMKLEASHEKDIEDVRVLVEHLGIETGDAALEQHRRVFPDSRRTPDARALLASIARNDEKLAPPTPIGALRRRWRAAMAADTFPRYEFEQASDGLFTLTVQHAEDGPREVLGKKLTLHALTLKERRHRGWPFEAADEIRQFAEGKIARDRALTR